MTMMLALVAAVGIALFFSGLPLGTDSRIRTRIDPYTSGYRARPRYPVGTVLASRIASLLPGGGTHDLSARLAAAGSDLDVASFRTEQFAAAVAGGVTGIGIPLLAGAVGMDMEIGVLVPLAVLLSCAGWLGRDWMLSRRIERRSAALRDELPAAIDLMTLSIVAGESVQAACARIAEVLPYGIGREFGRVTADVRAGAPMIEALEGLAARIPEVGVGRFVDALSTGIEKGSPLADTLRAQADDVREARRRYLLEVGGRREVLMLVPVVFLILPVVVVFALYPGLVTLELLVP